jgi:hypothetical protein
MGWNSGGGVSSIFCQNPMGGGRGGSFAKNCHGGPPISGFIAFWLTSVLKFAWWVTLPIPTPSPPMRFHGFYKALGIIQMLHLVICHLCCSNLVLRHLWLIQKWKKGFFTKNVVLLMQLKLALSKREKVLFWTS